MKKGEIAEVWAWSWSRFGESPVPEVLRIELAEHSVILRSMDDGGEGLGGDRGQPGAVEGRGLRV